MEVDGPEYAELLADVADNIKRHEDFVIKKHSQPITDLPYFNVNRTYLKEALHKKIQCAEPFFIMSRIVNACINGVNVMAPTLNDLLTEIKAISVASVEGNVFSAGYRHVDQMAVIKINKPGVIGAVHEFVVGTVLNLLRNRTPCFMFTYGMVTCHSKTFKEGELKRGDSMKICRGDAKLDNIIVEYLDAKPLGEMMHILSLEDMGKALLLVFASLQIAATEFEYCHYDLHTGNIMIRQLDRPISVKLNVLGADLIVNTRYIPVIIDYGFSRLKYEGKVYYKLDGHTFGIAGSNDTILKANHSIDIYKLVSNILLGAIGGLHQPSVRNFCSQLVESMTPNFFPADMERFAKFFADPKEGAVDLRKSYGYPKLSVKDNSFSYVLSFLKRFASKSIISQPRCDINFADKIFGMNKGKVVHNACAGEDGPLVDVNGHKRSIFDCAKYYFDGTFNVMEFKKGTTIYHGSPALVYHNSEMPLGVEYYRWSEKNAITAPLRKQLQEKGSATLLDKIQPITLSFYGDLRIAQEYSDTPMDLPGLEGKKFVCGPMCTNAYKMIQKVILVDMSDPYNIRKLSDLLLLPDAFLLTLYHGLDYKGISEDLTPENGEAVLRMYNKLLAGDPAVVPLVKSSIDMWKKRFVDARKEENIFTKSSHYKDGVLVPAPGPGILTIKENYIKYNDAHPLKRFFAKNLHRSSMRLPDYKLPNLLMGMFEKMQYAGYGNLPTHGRFGEIVLGKNVKKYIKRDYGNPYDWQYNSGQYFFGAIGKLLRDMIKYKTTNIDFHAGDLIQHSIWCALWIQYMFKTEYPVCAYLRNMKDMLIGSALLHDIGKGGDFVYVFYDKEDHAETGFEMFVKDEYKTENGVIKLSDVLKEMNLSDKAPFIMFLIRNHWLMGSVLKDENDVGIASRKIYDKFAAAYTRVGFPDNKNSKIAAYSCLHVLWLADVLASQPFPGHEKMAELSQMILKDPTGKRVNFYFNEILEDFPYIANMPKVHRGRNKEKDFGLDYLSSVGKATTIWKNVIQVLSVS